MAVDWEAAVAAAALVGTFVQGINSWVRNRGQARVTDDARLRDDQRELIGVLRQDNSDVRGRLDAAERTIRKQDELIRQLQHRLDEQDREIAAMKARQHDIDRGPV